MNESYLLDKQLKSKRFGTINAVFLTYEPNFSNSSENYKEVIKFYKNNIEEYCKAKKYSNNFKLTIVDNISSIDFRKHLEEIADLNNIEVMYIDEWVLSYDAFNYYIEKNKNTNDIYIWLASDTKPNHKEWLSFLIEDLIETNTNMAFPTVTADGAAWLPQSQIKPINKKPTLIEFPNYFHLICFAITGRILERFDWLLPNKYKLNGNDKGLSLMALAANEKICLSYRSNLDHHNLFPFKHQWVNDEKRKGRVQEYTHLSILEAGLNAYGHNLFSLSQYIRYTSHPNNLKLNADKIEKPQSIRLKIKLIILFIKRNLAYLRSKRGREKLLVNIGYYIVVNYNKKRFLELNFEERKKLIFDIYWE